MLKAENAKKLLALLEKEVDNTAIYTQTLDVLLEQGFRPLSLDASLCPQGSVYTFVDSEGPAHIGRSYTFLLCPDVSEYTLLINRGEECSDLVYGLITPSEAEEGPTHPILAKGKELLKTYTEEKKIRVDRGISSLITLVKVMGIRNAIVDAQEKGLYEAAEHSTSELDLWDQGNL